MNNPEWLEDCKGRGPSIKEAKEEARRKESEMTDDEIERLLAEKVMGWVLKDNRWEGLKDGMDAWSWSPTQHYTQAIDVLEAFVEKYNFHVQVDCHPGPEYRAFVWAKEEKIAYADNLPCALSTAIAYMLMEMKGE